jgi:hypothetical protein
MKKELGDRGLITVVGMTPMTMYFVLDGGPSKKNR